MAERNGVGLFVERDAGVVHILAIGVKIRDRLYIGGEEVER